MLSGYRRQLEATPPFEIEIVGGLLQKRLLLSDEQLRLVVVRMPSVLSFSFEDNIKPSLAALQSRLEDLGLQAGSGARPPQPLRHWLSLRMANRGGAEEGTPELYFSDPDGIAIQLQDKSYCGGSGYLGDECPALE